MARVKSVILDPTRLYQIPDGYIPITTEVEWLKFFFQDNCAYWIQGKLLCDWTREWLYIWDKTDAIVEEKQHPRLKLASIFNPLPLPSEWDDKQILELVIELEPYPVDNAIAHLLSEITTDSDNLWFEPPSIEHLSRWLSIQVPSKYQFFEQVWQNKIQSLNLELASYYQTNDKLIFLKQWLGLLEPPIKELPVYPREIPDILASEFDNFWNAQILKTQGGILDAIVPHEQPGIKRIAAIASNILTKKTAWITKERIAKISAYLNFQQRIDLNNQQPPSQPQPLALETSVSDVLEWVTKSYLPFRKWEIAIKKSPIGQRLSDRLANTFLEWLFKHYPELKLDSVSHSTLNYNVTYLVKELCQKNPVFWVVIDGLGWLDHQELLKILTEENNLKITTDISGRFSILPTKTEYAKWSLYSQLLPDHESWNMEINKAFSLIGIGKRYTDKQRHHLDQDLQQNAHQLYCWDTNQLDDIYHSERNWQNLDQVQRPHTLEGIAKQIGYCLKRHPNPENLKIVISSDHGQMIGPVETLKDAPQEITTKGRMAIGKTNDPRFIVLESGRFSLPHDVSIVRDAACLGSFNTTDGSAIGTHGGLFPEEVVVGVSVLSLLVERYPIIIICSGEGKPNETGTLKITIDNPNSVSITDLYLYINELPNLKAGKYLDAEITAQDKITLDLEIANWPELPISQREKQLFLSGKLQFRFNHTELGICSLEPTSSITINRIFQSRLNIDEFT